MQFSQNKTIMIKQNKMTRKTIQYTTGREYCSKGTPQTISITFLPFPMEIWSADDAWEEELATFDDPVRNIAGIVKVPRHECNDKDIARAVIASYDCGNYKLA